MQNFPGANLGSKEAVGIHHVHEIVPFFADFSMVHANIQNV